MSNKKAVALLPASLPTTIHQTKRKELQILAKVGSLLHNTLDESTSFESAKCNIFLNYLFMLTLKFPSIGRKPILKL